MTKEEAFAKARAKVEENKIRNAMDPMVETRDGRMVRQSAVVADRMIENGEGVEAADKYLKNKEQAIQAALKNAKTR